MNYNGIGFNENWVKSVSEKEFVEHEAHHGLTEKQLKEAYKLMNPKKLQSKNDDTGGLVKEGGEDQPE